MSANSDDECSLSPAMSALSFLACWLGRRDLAFHHSSMLLSALKSLIITLSTLIARRSSRSSLLNEDHLDCLIFLSVEKILSSFPLETRRENNSWASFKAFVQLAALGE